MPAPSHTLPAPPALLAPPIPPAPTLAPAPVAPAPPPVYPAKPRLEVSQQRHSACIRSHGDTFWWESQGPDPIYPEVELPLRARADPVGTLCIHSYYILSPNVECDWVKVRDIWMKDKDGVWQAVPEPPQPGEKGLGQRHPVLREHFLHFTTQGPSWAKAASIGRYGWDYRRHMSRQDV